MIELEVISYVGKKGILVNWYCVCVVFNVEGNVVFGWWGLVGEMCIALLIFGL